MGNTLEVERPYLRLAGMIAGNLGSLPEGVVQYYLKKAEEIPAALSRGFTVTPKFALFVDLGIITVPGDYYHVTALKSFRKKNRKKFYYYNKIITGNNFPNPSRVLKPGDKLWVRVFEQIVNKFTTSEERMAFLATQKAVYVGAQGASLVFEQKRDQLPRGKWYASLDEPERLWQVADGDHGVPGIGCRLDGGFRWDLGYFEGHCLRDNAFFCFTEVGK